MILHELTPRGLSAFREQLLKAREGDHTDFSALLTLPGLSTLVYRGKDVVSTPPATKRELGNYLVGLLGELGDSDAILKREGIWAWLSLYWIDTLAPERSDGTRDVKSNYRWIPETDNYQNYYRHPLALPFRVCLMYPTGSTADVLLAGHITKPGELTEQLASNQEIFSSAALLGAASQLYIDSKTGIPKTNAAGKNVPGSVRRYSAVVNQLARTWDLSAMTPQTVIAKLPIEFSAFV